jgi:hypothetical protein
MKAAGKAGAHEVGGDFQEGHWQTVIDGALRFADEWAGQAYALGWQPNELFGLDAVAPAAPHLLAGPGLWAAISCLLPDGL